MSDLHQVVFKWPRTEPSTVIVTGTFDKWASSIHLAKVPSGFEAVIQIPWEQKIKYKFIVDGEWRLQENQPTEVEPSGFVNNVYTAPAKPVTLPALETSPLPVEPEKPTAAEANNHRSNGDSVATEVVDKPGYTPQSLMGTDNLASTITTRHGVSSPLASGHSAVSDDPINIPKIAIPTPKSNGDSAPSPGMGTMSHTIVEDSAPNSSPSPVAPLVPIAIVAVNAAENNTTGSSPPPESMHVLPHLAPEPSKVPEEKANGRSPELPVVDTSHIQSVVEASSERTIESSLAPVTNTLPTSEAVTQESASEQTSIPVIKPVDATSLNSELAVPSETSTTPSTATNVEAKPVSTPSVTLTAPGVPTSSSPGLVAEESTTDPESIVATNLVTEKAQTPSSVTEVEDVQKNAAKSSIIAPESHAVDTEVVTERKVAEPIATPTFPTTPRKKTPTTSSVKDMQDSPSSQTNSPSQSTDNSPSSSRINSVRKKRTSIFGKIKHVLHLDKEKETK